MLELGGFQLPYAAVSGLCLSAAAAIGAILFLSVLTPPEPEKPWRWGDAPRDSRASPGLIGHVVGALLVFALAASAKAITG